MHVQPCVQPLRSESLSWGATRIRRREVGKPRCVDCLEPLPKTASGRRCLCLRCVCERLRALGFTIERRPDGITLLICNRTKC